MSALQVAVVQFAPGADASANRDAVRARAHLAASRGADLVVFPEYSSYFLSPMTAELAAHAEPLDGPFVAGLAAVAGEAGVTIVAGLVEAAGDRFRNTAVAVGADGLIATYRKQHLYDAFGQRESDFVEAGPLEDPRVFTVGGVVIGMQTCYDIRFPEVSRRLVDAGAQLIVVPAEWVRGPLKEFHWRTLLAARAIENTVYVAAADHVPPVGVGASMIIDPMGVAVAALGEAADIAVAPIDTARIDAVRATNPALALRRYGVVPLA